MTEILSSTTATVVTGAALLVALGIIGKATRAGFRWFGMVGRKLRAIEELVGRELDHNHGSSLKDDVTGIAVAVGKLGRDVDRLAREHRTDTDALRALIDHHHPPQETDDAAPL